MKLTTHAIRSLIGPLFAIFIVWATVFYFILSEELVDEVDDQLEVYSEQLMRLWLSGENMPDSTNGSNNAYYIRQITPSEAAIGKEVEYEFKNIYITSKHEEEPARVMHTVFKRADGTYWKLTVITPVYERNEVIGTILFFTLLLLATMLLAIIAIFTWVFIRHTKPLDKVLAYLDTYEIGNPQSLNNETGVTEFQHLNASVTACIQRVEEVYERERRFIGDAAHELQTPLAICQNRIEMMIEDENLSEAQMEELIKIQQTISELIRLNKTLLFLSKIENNQFIEKTQVILNTKLHSQVEPLSDIFATRGIKVTFYEKGEWIVTANDELMTALTRNLLRNAFLHNIPEGTIDIYIKNGAFCIANTGDCEALDSSKLFNRFYRDSHKKANSNGLGLSIVKAICEVNGLHITYSYTEKKHLFTISNKTSLA